MSKNAGGILNVHFWNAGAGECILLHMPDNKWGIIDCCTQNERHLNNLTKYLELQGVKELAFALLTHPHEDHFSGLAAIAHRFKAAELWRYPAPSVEDATADLKTEQIVVAGALIKPWPQNTDSLLQFLKYCRESKYKCGAQIKDVVQLSHRVHAYSGGSDRAGTSYSVVATGPSWRKIYSYQRWIDRVIQARGSVSDILRARYRHNLISVVVVVKFGVNRIILCSDAPAGYADNLVDDECSSGTVVVKVAHHGSRYSDTRQLCSRVRGVKRRIAVVTPFIGRRLPHVETVRDICEAFPIVVSTCQMVNESASALRFYEAASLAAKGVSPAKGDGGMCSISLRRDGTFDIQVQGSGHVMQNVS